MIDRKPRLLALRALNLGDLLVAVPALRALRTGFPGHHIILAAPQWLGEVVDLIGSVDELLPTSGLDTAIAVGRQDIDVAVNLHGNGAQSRSLLDAVGARVKIGHRAPGWDGPEWIDDIHERHRWTRLLTEHRVAADPEDFRLQRPKVPGIDPGAVVVHVGAAYNSRKWPTERFAAVARVLRRSGRRIILTGSAAERPRALEVAELSGLAEDSVVTGKTSLGGLAAWIANAALLISADTGAAHLASAFATPSVVLFGPAPPARWGPPRGPHIVLTDEAVRRGDVFASTPDPALLAVTAQDVLDAVATLPVDRL
ncbi:glycosyltransferase family 9 protein [Saxibacter everestensis]|uniref:Glycosyltransferase family 9 protein n=1 Tax=Saxibacter everestensis TaxID=2909229 RepID=A0ABY8QTE4_9MICO|nr:glycosyltransferase family 9 protein [Brevibacteriaceae bacterium ZFBP1038]